MLCGHCRSPLLASPKGGWYCPALDCTAPTLVSPGEPAVDTEAAAAASPPTDGGRPDDR